MELDMSKLRSHEHGPYWYYIDDVEYAEMLVAAVLLGHNGEYKRQLGGITRVMSGGEPILLYYHKASSADEEKDIWQIHVEGWRKLYET